MVMETKAKPIYAELSKDGKFVEIYFKPSPRWLEIMHSLNAKFLNPEKAAKVGVDVAHWRIASDFFAAKDLADAVGKENLDLGEALAEWAWAVRDLEKVVNEILDAKDWELERLPKVLPDLAKWMRPYQRVVVAYTAAVENPLNASQPGLGKTVETIGGIYEAGTEDGPNLVIAPKTSLESVWEAELMNHQKIPVIRASGDGMGKQGRQHAIADAEAALDMGKAFWLVVNPEMVRFRKRNREMGLVQDNLYSEFEFIHETEWNNIVVDEVHKNGMRNTQSVTAKGLLALKLAEGGKKIGLSGTPIGGKPINLFGILHWLYPDQFPSKYKWAERWLELEGSDYGTIIGDVKADTQEEFERHLAPIMIRHTKEQVLPELPPKDVHELWCSMTDTQQVQYLKFARMAEIELGDETLTATNVLAIYMRLKQFASATQRFENGILVPTEDSPKLNLLVEKLDELGIMDGSSDAQAIVASQFERMAKMVYEHLKAKGVAVSLLTGGAKGKTETVKSFQEGEAKVVVMTTDTGGVSITLDKADTVFILDEKWNPDDQTQVEDRAHRTSRMHQVTIYYIRTKETIEEYIRAVTGFKGKINKKILDSRTIKLY